MFATTSEGWLAHLNGNLLLIKTFPKVEVDELPPLQGEVEIFLAPNSLYIELENHGKYTLLKAGGSVSYQQKWYLEQVDEALLSDEQQLLKFIRNKVK